MLWSSIKARLSRRGASTMTTPIRVAVTGAGGQIGYALLFRLASGAVFGPEQPVALQLLEITPALPALNGTLMELEDCAFPLLAEMKASDKAAEAFAGADQDHPVGPGECLRGLVAGLHLGQERKGAILQFHQGPVQCGKGRGDFQQLQGDRLLGSENRSGSEPEQQGIADLASSPCHCHANRCRHRTCSFSGQCCFDPRS